MLAKYIASLVFAGRAARMAIAALIAVIAPVYFWYCPMVLAADQTDKRPLLRLEFSIKLPDIRTENKVDPRLTIVRNDGRGQVVWSPDGKFLLIQGSVSGNIYLIDVELKAIVLTIANEKQEGYVQGLAWSPDRHTIAFRETGGYGGIRLFSFPEFREIARRDQQVVTKGVCHFNHQWPAMQFTQDSSALWIGCDTGRPVAGPVLAAVKLNARTLEQEDTLILEAPVAGRPIELSSEPNRMYTVNGVPRYMTVVQALEPAPRPDTPSIHRNFLYVYDLNAKTPIFPHMEIPRDDRSGIFRGPRNPSVSGDGEMVAVDLSGYSTDSNVKIRKELDRSIELYRTKDGARILQLGGMGKEYGEYASGFFLRHTNVLAVIASPVQDTPEIVLITPTRNEVLQRIKLRGIAKFYPADARYLAVDIDDQLDVYQVSPE